MRIGITSTIPIEIILAAGHTAVDLNNVFVASDQAGSLVHSAELAGYPRNACSWVKGIYSSILESDIRTVIVVTQGDCSQMQAMMETLHGREIQFIPFPFPPDRNRDKLRGEMQLLADLLGTNLDDAANVQDALRPVRGKVASIDKLTWREQTVTGYENHFYQVSCSDFGGDICGFEQQIDGVLAAAEMRPPLISRARIGIVGVPPIYSDLYTYLDELGLHVAFNEVQRQFTMTPSLGQDLLTQYQNYTYPYDIHGRLQDIQAEKANRQLEGIVHYVQSFCYRQIYDHLLRDALDCPVLTLEGDRPGCLTGRDKLRLEAFAETLEARR